MRILANRRTHINELVVGKLRSLSATEVQHCFQIMEHTAWQDVRNPAGWIIGMVNRERRRLQAVGMLQHQVNERLQATEHQAEAGGQQAALMAPPEACHDGWAEAGVQQAPLMVHPEACHDGWAGGPAHEGRVGAWHGTDMHPGVQQAPLMVPPEARHDGWAGGPAHEGHVGAWHGMDAHPERFMMARPPQLMDILSEGLGDDDLLPAPGR